MATRQRVSPRRDKRIFRRTASRTDVKNIPGRVVQRGGIRLWLSIVMLITTS